MRKRRFSLLLILVMVATMLAGIRTESVSAATMRDVTAQEVVDAIDFGWNLGNDLDCFEENAGGYKGSPQAYERLWGNPPATKAMIDKVKETGINAIRIPVTWYHNMEGNNIRSNWLSRVKEVVDYAIDNDTYVIINVHHDTGVHGWLKATTNNAYQNEQKFVKIWEQVASYFKNYDEHLLFEGYNEIIDNSSNWNDTSYENYQECNKLNQLFVDTVRKSGGNNAKRVLITNTYAAAVQTSELNNFKKPTDSVPNKLIAEVHCYTPYKFCFKEYSDTHYGSDYDVYEFMDRTVSRFKSLGMPVIIGEEKVRDYLTDFEDALALISSASPALIRSNA